MPITKAENEESLCLNQQSSERWCTNGQTSRKTGGRIVSPDQLIVELEIFTLRAYKRL